MEKYAQQLGFVPAVFNPRYTTYCMGDYRLFVYHQHVEMFQHGYQLLIAGFTSRHQFVSNLAVFTPATAKLMLRQLRIESVMLPLPTFGIYDSQHLANF